VLKSVGISVMDFGTQITLNITIAIRIRVTIEIIIFGLK
jgi:hypothetical protein